MSTAKTLKQYPDAVVEFMVNPLCDAFGLIRGQVSTRGFSKIFMKNLTNLLTKGLGFTA